MRRMPKLKELRVWQTLITVCDSMEKFLAVEKAAAENPEEVYKRAAIR